MEVVRIGNAIAKNSNKQKTTITTRMSQVAWAMEGAASAQASS